MAQGRNYPLWAEKTLGGNNMSWRDIIKAQKPDYLDFDKDGDKEEPMTEALESAKKGYQSKEKRYGQRGMPEHHRNQTEEDEMAKSPTRKHYTKDGKEWKGKTHKMPDGNLMTEDPHNEKSVRLYHYDELPKSAARSAFTR